MVANRRYNHGGATKDDDGVWLNDSASVKQYLLRSIVGLENFFTSCISPMENDGLCAVSSTVKNFKVIKSMHPIKASISEGMPTFFYQFFGRWLVKTLFKWFKIFFIMV